MPEATRFLHDETPFDFHRGGRLKLLTVAYETWGTLNGDRSNAVLVLTGLSPNAHAAANSDDPSPGWWEPMIGPGKPIDTDRYFVVCVNSLGSCKGSTGPASINPETGQPWRLTFPDLAIEDIAAAAQRVVRHLGIERLCVLVGPSMGGMTALAWLLQNPAGARNFLTLSSAAKAEPFSIAIRSLQREMIVSDPHFDDGHYTGDKWPVNGMRMARKLGMISYRSAAEWRSRFGRKAQEHYEPRKFGMHFAVESYLEAAAEKFINAFDPACYLYLSRSMDWFDASAGHATLSAALASIKLDSAFVLGVESDILFPPHQQQALANSFSENGIQTGLIILPSLLGHDAFLVDYDHFKPQVAAYFNRVWTAEHRLR